MRDDTWFRLWFAFCAVLSIAWMAFLVWAIWALVQWVTTQ